MEELFDAAKTFEMYERAGRRIAIITNSGGPGVLATDKAELLGFAKLNEKTGEHLENSVDNPIANAD